VLGLTILVIVTAGIALAISAAKRDKRPAAAGTPGGPPTATDLKSKLANDAFTAAGGPKHFDPIKFISFYTTLAHASQPDAQLVTFSAYYVAPDGTSDLTLGDNGTGYAFRSPSNSQVPANTPIGVTKDLPCMQNMSVSAKWVSPTSSPSDRSADDCREPLVELPHCTLKEVWDRALVLGAPKNAVAWIWFESMRHDEWSDDREHVSFDPDKPTPGKWRFSIEHTDFDKSFPDDCGTPRDPNAPDPMALQIVRARGRLVADCFKQAFTRGSGKINSDLVATMVFTVGPDGVVKSVKVTGGDKDFNDCVGEMLDTHLTPAAAPTMTLHARVVNGTLQIGP
jgi:hypothetical protein